jgi:hypothetical protein
MGRYAGKVRSANEWNLTRFDPKAVDVRAGHFEGTFVKLVDPGAPRALWVKLDVFSPTLRTSGGPPHQRGQAVGQAWAIVFDRTGEELPGGPPSYRDAPLTSPERARHVAVKRTVAIEDALLARALPVQLEIAAVRFDGRRLDGEIVHGGVRVGFELVLTPRDDAPHAPFPFARMYEGTFPRSKQVSPLVDARADGEVTIHSAAGLRRWRVEQWPAMQGRSWGTRHSDLHAWAHVNAWNEPEGRELVIEVLCTRARISRRWATPLVTFVSARHRGVRYEARGVRALLGGRGRIDGLRTLVFDARQAGAEIEGEIALTDEDIVGLYQPSPDGTMSYRLQSALARAAVRFTPPGGRAFTVTSGSAALEIGTDVAGHGARMFV